MPAMRMEWNLEACVTLSPCTGEAHSGDRCLHFFQAFVLQIKTRKLNTECFSLFARFHSRSQSEYIETEQCQVSLLCLMGHGASQTLA